MVLHTNGVIPISRLKYQELKPFESFFDRWTPDMAYVLGFIAADGYVHGKSYRLEISLQSRDLPHLEAIRRSIGCHQKIIFRTKEKSYSLRVHSKATFYKLAALGIHQKKSLDMKWIDCPEEFLPHFIRGYFDGDGHIGLPKGRHVRLEILGTAAFLEGIANRCPISWNPIAKHGLSISRLRLSGLEAMKFCEWIYGSPGMRLERKYNVYLEAKKTGSMRAEQASRFLGVQKHGRTKSRWMASIFTKGTRYFLGTFETAEQAAMAYGQFSIENNLGRKLNFPKK